MTKYNVIVEKDEDGNFIASVQGVQGWYSEGESYEDAIKNIKEVIEIWKDIDKEQIKPLEFIGLQSLEI